MATKKVSVDNKIEEKLIYQFESNQKKNEIIRPIKILN